MKNWRGDLFGGLTAGVVAIPLALAFGVASGLGPMAGLYGAIGCGIIAALFGGTPVQISGPTGPMTVVTATVVAANLSATGEPNLALIFGTFALAGVFQVVLGLIRTGQYIRYIPYPVISGFMTGIGVIIIVLQVFPFFGQKSPSSKPLEVVLSLGSLFSGINTEATVLAAGTVVLVYLLPRITKAIPSSLLALIFGTLASYFLELDVPIIGEIPRGLPSLQSISLIPSDLMRMVVPAIELALLGAIDSLLTSVIADQVTKARHDSNRELIGQGLGNIVTGLMGGIPGAGATMRTVLNVNAGGRTRLSGVIHGLLLLGVLFEGAELVRYIPLSVLAGILVTVGLAIMDRRGMGHLFDVPRADAVIMVIVLGVTVFDDLINAVVGGLILASFVFMKKVGDISEEETRISELQNESWSDEEDIPANIRGSVYIKHIQGPLFFGFATAFQRIAESIPSGKLVILRFDRVSYLDQTGLYALDEAIAAFESRGARVLLSGMRGPHLAMARKIGIFPYRVTEDEVFDEFDDLKKALPEILDTVSARARASGADAP